MLISRLLRSLLRFFSMGIVPDEGGGAPTVTADTPPAVDTPPAATPAAPAEPEDSFAFLRTSLEKLGDPAGTPAVPAIPGQPRDAMGRFAPADLAAPVPTPAPSAAPAAATPAATPAPAPKPGEIDLTPPEGMNERSQQRWAQLTERAKQLPEFERRATEAESALDGVRQMVTGAGLAANEFTDMLETARLVKSTNPQDAQAALQRLDAIRADLAQRFGLDAAGVDALAAHPDLKQKVDGMLLTREDALEIARLRAGNQQGQQVVQAQREQSEFQQTVNSAATAMETALAARAGEPGHQGKLQYIGNHFKNPANLQAFVKTYQPHQWQGVLMMMYDAYTPPPVVAAATPVPPVQQPLRPSAARAGAAVQTQPLTAMDAVQGAFNNLGLGG